MSKDKNNTPKYIELKKKIETIIESALIGKEDRTSDGLAWEIIMELTKTIESEREKYLKGFIKLGYGKRCKEYEEGCPTCDEWKLYDEYINKLT